MCRLWQDAENRVYLIKELDRITGQVGIPCYALSFVPCGCFSFLFFFLLWVCKFMFLEQNDFSQLHIWFEEVPVLGVMQCQQV